MEHNEEYEKHYSPDGERIEYLMEHPEKNNQPIEEKCCEKCWDLSLSDDTRTCFITDCPCHKSESIEWEKDLSFRFDTWLKLYPGIPTIGEIEEWLLESLRISDECFSTNDHSKSESIEWKEALDSFIKKWVPGSYAHLSDNDENDGERLRTAIQDAITAAVEAREREISEAVDIVGIDCGCVLGKCKMCASIDFIKSEILSFITTAVAKRDEFYQKNEERRLERYEALDWHKGKMAERKRIVEMIEKMVGFTDGVESHSFIDKDKILKIIKH